MPDAVAQLARIWLSVTLAVYGLIVIVQLHSRRGDWLSWSVMLSAFTASAIVLFHSFLFRIPGWPVASTALFVTLIGVGTARYVGTSYGRRADD